MEAFDKSKVVMDTPITFPEFVDPETQRDVADSHTFSQGAWETIGQFRDAPPGVKKAVIPVNIKEYCMMVITEVGPNTSVRKHSHKEGIVRYIINGTLLQSGVQYSAGDWVFVPPGVPYEITTKGGYKAMCLYRNYCDGGE
ncbi:hypothetical protein R70006_05063 [Paraburkholderia domus]|uniref:cupin domain-containing protein n=1 Tax=Paraburkholderia domus TaxID=2793075 RepID=UPI001912C402|nr:cupin domain-containing protein [Paraburkholderia domus]MBK5051700.1 hypothetical protein [Burkholderia sp. R-70006]CAE6795707.1 hypothetical protein R70006_05063 [Paraburkholderia domus]